MTSTLLFANNAGSTLAGPISNTSLTLQVQAGGGALFPNPGIAQYFLCSLTDAATGLLNEIVQVTARSGDVFTIVRGQEGTTALSWLANDIVANRWTAGSAGTMVQVAQLQEQATNYAVDTGTANAIAITLNPVPASMSQLIGAPLRIKKSAAASTGAVTVNVNGLGGVSLVYPSGAALSSTFTLPASGILTAIFDGTNFELQSVQHPPASQIASQVFTSSGTFTIPAENVEYEIWGGGGGAGGTLGAGSASSSGAGGGYCYGMATGLTIGGTVAVTVGTGGAGGDGTPHNGTAGGTSSFGAFGSATGGGGGLGANGAIQTSAPAGGAGSGGTLTYPGLGGGFGFVVGSAMSAAIGGAAFKAPAPSPQVNTIPTAGNAGTYPGVGGNGSTNGASGGNGANGLVIVRWVLPN